MKSKRMRIAVTVAVPMLAGCFAASGYAAQASGTVASGSAQVLSGGVGQDARQQLAAQARGHELKVVFASTSGAYLADVPVTITDKSGRTVVDTVSQGPWMFVDLPSGTYKIRATLGDKTQTSTVSVKEGGQKTVYIRWRDNEGATVVHSAGK